MCALQVGLCVGNCVLLLTLADPHLDVAGGPLAVAVARAGAAWFHVPKRAVVVGVEATAADWPTDQKEIEHGNINKSIDATHRSASMPTGLDTIPPKLDVHSIQLDGCVPITDAFVCVVSAATSWAAQVDVR